MPLIAKILIMLLVAAAIALALAAWLWCHVPEDAKAGDVFCTVTGVTQTKIPFLYQATVIYRHRGKGYTCLTRPALRKNLPRPNARRNGTLYRVRRKNAPPVFWVEFRKPGKD